MPPEDTLELPWTGERYVPQLRGNIALEHLHRYAFACHFARDKIVLDLASGEGFGSDMLARHARCVFGVDIDKQAVAHSQKQYTRANLTFLDGACESLPLADQSLDLVVSFETIEHVSSHSEMLREITRCLKPGGLLLISTPERNIYNAGRPTPNSFHKLELSEAEFEHLLHSHFRHVSMLGQCIVSGSSIYGLQARSKTVSGFDFSMLPANTSPLVSLFQPTYLLAFCSNHTLPHIEDSFCMQELADTDYTKQQEALMQAEKSAALAALTATMQAEIELLNTKVANAELEAFEQRENLISLRRHMHRMHVELGTLSKRYVEIDDALAATKNSSSWRLTSPIRAVAQLLRIGPARLATSAAIPSRHYEAIRDSGLFDDQYYLRMNPDVANAGVDPLLHYINHGAAEGRDPSEHFCTKDCLARISRIRPDSRSHDALTAFLWEQYSQLGPAQSAQHAIHRPTSTT